MKITLSTNQTVFVDFHVSKGAKKRITACTVQDATAADGSALARGVLFGKGEAQCHSKKDKYNKAVGKAKALDRALQNAFPLESDRTVRKEIWMHFFRHMKDCPDMRFLKGVTTETLGL